MSVTYKYNGVDVFSGLAQAPLLERSEEYIRTGDTFARADSFILSGQLKRTDCGGGFATTYALTKSLILAFAKNFQRFEIISDSIVIFSHDNAIVESITIDQNKYYNLIPFTIKLLCYTDYYASLYGVLEPKDVYDYNEEDGELVTITHTVSARGINTSSTALDNARNFVSGLTGYLTLISPVGYEIDDVPILIKKDESINRYTGEVTTVETFLWDKSHASDNPLIILTYTTDLSESDGVITVVVSGKVQGAMDADFTATRTALTALSFYTLANTEYQTIGTGNLPAYPIGYSADENRDENSITFSYTYQNDTTNDPFVVDSTTITREGARQCIDVTLQIQSNFGCPAERLRKTRAYLDALDFDAYISSKWTLYGTGGRIGPVITKQVSVDTQTGTITIQSKSCNDNTEDCGCLEALKYSIDIQPAIPQFGEEAAYAGEGCYYIQDLNFNSRAKITIAGSARPSKCCTNEAVKSQVYSRVHQLMTEYFQASDIILIAAQVEVATDRSIVSFSFSWDGSQSSGLSDAYVFATF